MRVLKLTYITSTTTLAYMLMMLFSSIPLYAGKDTVTMRLEKLTIQDGLSQGLVMSCMQDKEGVMWFSTKDGLNKYDGYTFTAYRHNLTDPFSLPDNFVTHTVEDSHGIFWVATATKGLYIFDKINEKFYPVIINNELQELSNETIWNIKIIDSVLFLQSSIHAYLYDISTIIKRRGISSPQSITELLFKYTTERVHQVTTHKVTFMPDKSLWITMNDSIRVLSFNPHTKTYIQSSSYSTKNLPIQDRLGQYDIYPLRNVHHKLINDNGRISIYDFSTHSVIRSFHYSNDEWHRQLIVQDRKQQYWLLSSDTIQYCLNTMTYQLTPYKCKDFHYNTNRGYTVCFDNNDRLWVGTTGHGILKYDYRKNLWQTFKNPHNILYTLYGKEEILCTTNEFEPCIYNLKTRTRRNIVPQKVWRKNWQAWSFIYADNNTFIGVIIENTTRKKYLFSYCFNDNKFIKVPYPHSVTVGYQNFIKDKNGELWITGLKDDHSPILIQLDKKNLSIKKTHFFPAKKEYNEYAFVSGWFQDNSSTLWFATLQGLFSFDKKNYKWGHFESTPNNKSSSLPTNSLFSLCPDPINPEKYIWIGTNGHGLIKFNRLLHTSSVFTENDGLPNNVVYSVLADKNNNLWISTNKGLCCLPSHKIQNKEPTFIPFSIDDGLSDNEFNRYEALQFPNGELLFGGIQGKTYFSPETVLNNEITGNIVLSDISVFNKSVDHKNHPSILRSNISYAQDIYLSYEQRMFTLSFSLLNYCLNSKKKYRYILDGYDNTWVESGMKNEATYTNIPPGTYTFRVSGTLHGYEWGKKEASIRITILPAWWQTWWCRMCIVLLLVLVLYGIYRYRLREKIKILVLRDRIAGDLHDEIGSTLSSISLAGSVLQKKLSDSNGDVQYLLNQISTNTNAMMEAMSDIVWAVNSQNDSFDNIVYRMRAFTSEILEPKNCVAHFHITENIRTLIPDMNQRKNIYLIFKEAVNNAAKYSQATHVWITLSIKEKVVTLSIKDDGAGFDMHYIQDQKRLSGNGLHSMKKRAAELDGNFILHSEPGNGTDITVQFTL